MTDPSENQHRDQRTLRHLVQIDTEGKVHALPIAEKKAGGPDRPRVLIFPAAGGCTIVPGITIADLLTPMPDEPGIARMAAVYDRLRKLQLDVGGEGLPIDMLEAGAAQLEEFVQNIRPDLENWDKSIRQVEGELLECSTIALDRLHAGDLSAEAANRVDDGVRLLERVEAPFFGQAVQHVRRLAAELLAWQEGASLLARQGHLSVWTYDGETAADAPPIDRPREFWERLRSILAAGKSAAELLARMREAEGDKDTAAESAVARAEAESTTIRQRIAGPPARTRRRASAPSTAPGPGRAEIAARVDAVPGVLRIHWPEGVPLRAMVAPGTSADDQKAVHEMITTAIGDPELEFIVDTEPGVPPEGWAVWAGTRPGDPGEGWLYGVGDHDDQDSLQDADAMGREDTEADAVDRTWELAAEDRGDGNRPGEDD